MSVEALERGKAFCVEMPTDGQVDLSPVPTQSVAEQPVSTQLVSPQPVPKPIPTRPVPMEEVEEFRPFLRDKLSPDALQEIFSQSQECYMDIGLVSEVLADALAQDAGSVFYAAGELVKEPMEHLISLNNDQSERERHILDASNIAWGNLFQQGSGAADYNYWEKVQNLGLKDSCWRLDGTRGEFTSVLPNPNGGTSPLLLDRKNGKWFNDICRSIVTRFSSEKGVDFQKCEEAIRAFVGWFYVQGVGLATALSIASENVSKQTQESSRRIWEKFNDAKDCFIYAGDSDTIDCKKCRKVHLEICDDGTILVRGCFAIDEKTWNEGINYHMKCRPVPTSRAGILQEHGVSPDSQNSFLYSYAEFRLSVEKDGDRWIPHTEILDATMCMRCFFLDDGSQVEVPARQTKISDSCCNLA
jgi:hypothetical protein